MFVYPERAMWNISARIVAQHLSDACYYMPLASVQDADETAWALTILTGWEHGVTSLCDSETRQEQHWVLPTGR